MVKPTGWHTVKYENVDGRYLYNRCHLIGYQLTGENANKKNLITGTRYLNVTGMLPFENEVADYVHSTGNPCMYRVTPFFKGDELVAEVWKWKPNPLKTRRYLSMFSFITYSRELKLIILQETAGKNRVYEAKSEKIVTVHSVLSNRKY